MDEQYIIKQLKKNNESILSYIMEKYLPYVLAVIRYRVGTVCSKEDMEEVALDVFFALWQQAGKLDAKKGTIKSYLGAIARHKAMNKLREVKQHEDIMAYAHAFAAKDNVEQQMIRQDAVEKLIAAVDTLPELERELFYLYYMEEHTLDEVAKLCNLSLSTTKTKLYRSRKRIQQILRKQGVYYELERL